MEILLDGKRIFEVDNSNYDYVVFPANKIQTYIQLNGYLIKKETCNTLKNGSTCKMLQT